MAAQVCRPSASFPLRMRFHLGYHATSTRKQRVVLGKARGSCALPHAHTFVLSTRVRMCMPWDHGSPSPAVCAADRRAPSFTPSAGSCMAVPAMTVLVSCAMHAWCSSCASLDSHADLHCACAYVCAQVKLASRGWWPSPRTGERCALCNADCVTGLVFGYVNAGQPLMNFWNGKPNIVCARCVTQTVGSGT